MESAEAAANGSRHDVGSNAGLSGNPRSAPNRRSASELGHVAVMTTNMVDNRPGNVQLTFDNEDSSVWNVLCSPPRPAQSRSIEEEIESLIYIPL